MESDLCSEQSDLILNQYQVTSSDTKADQIMLEHRRALGT